MSYASVFAGTPITWASSGGDKTFAPTSLANGSGWQGDKSATLVHATYGMPEYLDCRLESAVVSAVSDKAIELWFGGSDDGTAGNANPGNLSGVSGSLANPDEMKVQCDRVGTLHFQNSRGTNMQMQRLVYVAKLPFLIPVWVNKSGVALSATAAIHKLVVTPYYRKIV